MRLCLHMNERRGIYMQKPPTRLELVSTVKQLTKSVFSEFTVEVMCVATGYTPVCLRCNGV